MYTPLTSILPCKQGHKYDPVVWNGSEFMLSSEYNLHTVGSNLSTLQAKYRMCDRGKTLNFPNIIVDEISINVDVDGIQERLEWVGERQTVVEHRLTGVSSENTLHLCATTLKELILRGNLKVSSASPLQWEPFLQKFLPESYDILILDYIDIAEVVENRYFAQCLAEAVYALYAERSLVVSEHSTLTFKHLNFVNVFPFGSTPTSGQLWLKKIYSTHISKQLTDFDAIIAKLKTNYIYSKDETLLVNASKLGTYTLIDTKITTPWNIIQGSNVEYVYNYKDGHYCLYGVVPTTVYLLKSGLGVDVTTSAKRIDVQLSESLIQTFGGIQHTNFNFYPNPNFVQGINGVLVSSTASQHTISIDPTVIASITNYTAGVGITYIRHRFSVDPAAIPSFVGINGIGISNGDIAIDYDTLVLGSPAIISALAPVTATNVGSDVTLSCDIDFQGTATDIFKNLEKTIPTIENLSWNSITIAMKQSLACPIINVFNHVMGTVHLTPLISVPVLPLRGSAEESSLSLLLPLQEWLQTNTGNPKIQVTPEVLQQYKIQVLNLENFRIERDTLYYSDLTSNIQLEYSPLTAYATSLLSGCCW